MEGEREGGQGHSCDKEVRMKDVASVWSRGKQTPPKNSRETCSSFIAVTFARCEQLSFMFTNLEEANFLSKTLVKNVSWGPHPFLFGVHWLLDKQSH